MTDEEYEKKCDRVGSTERECNLSETLGRNVTSTFGSLFLSTDDFKYTTATQKF
jgi:hypothetical protein